MGPSTLAGFQTFSGFGVKAVKAATAPLKLEGTLENMDGWLILPEDRAAFEAFRAPKEACFALVSSLDWLAIDGMTEPVHHAILDRGRMVGVWAYDTATESIAWRASIKRNKDLARAIARTEEFVRTQLGDARSFSLDSPKSRAPIIEALNRSSKL
jgi:hypothetical protein